MSCTKEERLALIHLAEGYFVNPRNVELIERLMQRGLIRRDPDFQVANRSFARFVLTAESRDTQNCRRSRLESNDKDF
jgi:hypothetical protein